MFTPRLNLTINKQQNTQTFISIKFCCLFLSPPYGTFTTLLFCTSVFTFNSCEYSFAGFLHRSTCCHNWTVASIEMFYIQYNVSDCENSWNSVIFLVVLVRCPLQLSNYSLIFQTSVFQVISRQHN